MFWYDIDADGRGHSIWVHREMMEKHLGRSLDRNEVVHHKNSVPWDNRIENFEVRTRANHASGHKKPTPTVTISCPQCGKENVFPLRVLRRSMKIGRTGLFCNKHCSGSWIRQRQIEQGIVPRGCAVQTLSEEEVRARKAAKAAYMRDLRRRRRENAGMA